MAEIFFGKSRLMRKYDSFHVVAEVNALTVEIHCEIGLIENLGESYLHDLLLFIA